MNSRQQTILQMVIDQGQVSVTDLAKATGVSEVTIRQDLNTLEKLSYLRRAHGFAVSLDSDDVETRMMSNYTLKRELAEFAASLVQPGETIFIENGSSNALLARTLGEQKKNVTIITVSSYIAHLLKDAPCEVILLGGVYQKKSESICLSVFHRSLYSSAPAPIYSFVLSIKVTAMTRHAPATTRTYLFLNHLTYKPAAPFNAIQNTILTTAHPSATTPIFSPLSIVSAGISVT